MGKFTSDNQPKDRGKSFKTKLMAALKKESMIDVGDDETEEEAFIRHWAKRAFDPSDASSGMLLKGIADRCYPALKSTMPTVDFAFDPEATPSEQVIQILDAAASDNLPPDVANIFIQSIKAAVDVQLGTDLKARIEALESLLDERSS